MTRPQRDATDSGVAVYPPLQIPKRRDSAPRVPRRARAWKAIALALLGAALSGVVGGVLLRPYVMPDPRLEPLEARLAEGATALAAEQARAVQLAKDLEAATGAKRDIEQRLTVASKAEAKLADTTTATAQRAKALEATQKKLVAAMKGAATVSVAGGEVRLSIESSRLFAKDDALSERGKQLLARIGGALKDLSDRVSVEGHTDDTPPPTPRAPAPTAAKRGAKPPPPAAPPPPRFATNWELSTGRALAVVRYLQDSAKLDPARLSATGFGAHRPLAGRDKAANRRIEIAVAPPR